MKRILVPLMLITVALVLLSLSACTSTEKTGSVSSNNTVSIDESVTVLPDSEPGIRGVITKADSTAGSGFILVEENPSDTSGSQKASVRLNDQTKIYQRSGLALEKISQSALTAGKKVSVWFAGPVAESYPVQGSAAVAGYYLVRHSRGSIKMILNGTAYSPGGTIEGSFTMTTKKPLEGKRLLVAVIGQEMTEERDGNTTRTRSREIYRDEQIIEDARTYPAGETKEHTFQIKVPDISDDGANDGVLGEAVELGLELLSGRDERLEWKVEARLDASGIDLSDSKRIYLNAGR